MKGRRWIVGRLLFLLLAGIAWGAGYSTAGAAGANISIKTDANPVVKGDIFYVMITVSSTEAIGGFEGYFSYNQGAMKYLTGGSVSSGNDDVFSISDTDRETGSRRLKYSIQFQARRSGSSTVELKSPYRVYNEDQSETMSVAFDSLNIRVLSKKEARRLQEAPPEAAEEPSVEEEQEQSLSGEQSSTEQPEGNEGRDLPEKTEEAAPSPAVRTDPPRQTDNAAAEPDVDSGRGLSRSVCIVVIILASANLIVLAILFFRLKEQEAWTEEQDTEFDQEEMAGESRRAGDTDEGEDPGEDAAGRNESGELDSLEQIESRLEQKRRWLRKDDN